MRLARRWRMRRAGVGGGRRHAAGLASLRDARGEGDLFRWCRFAQPPATGCHASGMEWGEYAFVAGFSEPGSGPGETGRRMGSGIEYCTRGRSIRDRAVAREVRIQYPGVIFFPPFRVFRVFRGFTSSNPPVHPIYLPRNTRTTRKGSRNYMVVISACRRMHPHGFGAPLPGLSDAVPLGQKGARIRRNPRYWVVFSLRRRRAPRDAQATIARSAVVGSGTGLTV